MFGVSSVTFTVRILVNCLNNCECSVYEVRRVTSGAVKMEKYEDRIRDFSASWKQLFGFLNFGNIDDFEEKYRGI